MKTSIIIGSMVLATFAITPNIALAQVNQVENQETEGKLIRKDGANITIETDNGIQQITVPNNVSITQDARPVTLDDININDHVSATTDLNGQVLAIESTSTTAENARNTSLLVGGLLLAGLIVAAMARMKASQGHIKTTIDNSRAATR